MINQVVRGIRHKALIRQKVKGEVRDDAHRFQSSQFRFKGRYQDLVPPGVRFQVLSAADALSALAYQVYGLILIYGYPSAIDILPGNHPYVHLICPNPVNQESFFGIHA